MVSQQTIDARDGKQAEQKRLIEEVEKQIGKQVDHPEDEGVLRTRSVLPGQSHQWSEEI
jgi:hypothetical protein